MKKLLAALLTLPFLLTACGGGGLTTFDAQDYLKGLLNATYLGQFDPDYLAQVDLTEEEARAAYEEGLELEYGYFSSFFRFDEACLTDETRQSAKDLLAELCGQARWEVGAASKSDGGFTVEVTVRPVDLIARVSEQYMPAYAEAFRAKYAGTTQGDLEAMPEEERTAFLAAYENDWATGVTELLRSHLSELDYLEPVSLLVRFLPDEEGYYSIPDTDFANLDALILAYEF